MSDSPTLIENMLPPTRLAKYPHMFPGDIEIWERFLDDHADEYLGFIYDQKVGSGTEPIDSLQQPYKAMQAFLSKYRVDVIGVKQNGLDIIEVKPMAGTNALGQVTAYMKLYEDEYKPELPLRGVIVTDYERPDVRGLAEHMGMKYYIQ